MPEKPIIKRLAVGSLSANCWIVGSESVGEGLVIDPGGNSETIKRAIDETGLDIKIIVLTHGHSDHIAALRDVQDKTGAEVAIHIEDADFLEGRGSYSSQFGISYRTPHPPERLLREGDKIEVGGMSFAVIHTPGHTPGSISLLTDFGVISQRCGWSQGNAARRMPRRMNYCKAHSPNLYFIAFSAQRPADGHPIGYAELRARKSRVSNVYRHLSASYPGRHAARGHYFDIQSGLVNERVLWFDR